MLLSLTAAAALAICPPTGPRHHCVHDGDTVWWNGEKIRLADIDAPELRARCPAESALAIAARDRLVQLLNAGPVTIVTKGRDRYRRTLALMELPDGDIGERLIGEGLASRWPQRRDWCAGA